MALLRCIPLLDKLILEGDELIGRNIIRRALEEPIRKISENAGMEASVVVNKVKEEKPNVGYDAAQDKFVDMIQAGVIDPTKVTRSALQNAAGVASLLLMTEALVTDIPEKDKSAGGMSGGMPGGMPGGGMY